MEKNDLSKIIAFIKICLNKEEYSVIDIKEYNEKFYCGVVKNGTFVEMPFELEIINFENLCQDLYDVLIAEFNENIRKGYSYSIGIDYKYYMLIGNNVKINFPVLYEYYGWIKNRIREDIEERQLKLK